MVGFQFWAYGLALTGLMIPGLTASQKQVRLYGDIIALANDYSIATNETSFEIDTVQVIDSRISQAVKFEGLPFEYSASKKQDYPSKLGYVALFNLTTYESTSTSLQYFNRDQVDFSIGYRTDDKPNLNGLSLATNRPIVTIPSSAARKLVQAMEDHPSSLYLRMSFLDAQGDEITSTNIIKSESNTGAIIGGAVGGAVGVIALLLAAFFIRMTIRRRHYDRARAGRRGQGIETLQANLKKSAAGPLDPQLLQYIPEIDTKRRDLADLKRAAPLHHSHDSEASMLDTRGDDQVDEDADLRQASTRQASQVHFSSAPVNEKVLGGLLTHDGPADVSADMDGTHETCSVCIDDIEKGQKIRQLPCFHIFHVECIDQWLLEKSSACPLCKFDVARHCIQMAGPGYRPPVAAPKKGPNEEHTIYIY
ncbi:hypothetical protein H4R33_001697 [Dimargaris cristalligena]|nr:hypothetical protein H4R33_001697 [Dimargaris cristalligena]